MTTRLSFETDGDDPLDEMRRILAAQGFPPEAVENVTAEIHVDLTVATATDATTPTEEPQDAADAIEAVNGSSEAQSEENGDRGESEAEAEAQRPESRLNKGAHGNAQGKGKKEKNPRPDVGEVQEPYNDPNPPTVNSHGHIALVVLAYHLLDAGKDWAGSTELINLSYNPLSKKQTHSSLSRLYNKYGLLRRTRRPPEESEDARYELDLQPTERGREAVRELGPFDWPVDAELPAQIPDPAPFTTDDHPDEPATNPAELD